MALQTLDLSASAAGLAAAPRRSARVRAVAVLRVALLLLVVGQLGRVPVLQAGSKDAPILLNDLLVLSVVAAGGLVALQRRRLVLDRPAALGLAFAAVGGLSALAAVPRFGLSAFQLVFSLAYLARWLAYFGVYVTAVNVLRDEDLPGVYGTLLSAVLAFSLFGIVQSAFLPDFAFLVYPEAAAYTDWDPQGHRLVSTLLDPNYAGSLIVLTLLPALALVSYGVRVAPWKLVTLFVALGLTVSRGAIVAFAVGVAVILLGRGISRRLVRLGALLGLALVVLLPVLLRFALAYNKLQLDRSALGRVLGWVRALEVFSEHPVIGVGFNTYGFVQQLLYRGDGLTRASFGLDGGILLIAVLTGTVGLVLYLAMVAVVGMRCRRVWRDGGADPWHRGLALGTAAATAAVVVHGFFLNTLLYPFVIEALWVLWATTYVAARAGRRHPAGAAAW